MGRVNMTLDAGSYAKLRRYAKRLKRPQATAARELVSEGLARHEAQERQRKLAADYAAGRRDTRAVLREMEAGQLEIIGDEDA